MDKNILSISEAASLLGVSDEILESKTIFRFKILHKGWGMDNDGWVEQNEHGQCKVLTTNHWKTC